MSSKRVIELHREIARLHEELADELARDDAANDDEPTQKPRRKQRPKAYPAPLHPVSDTDRIRARKILERRGYG